MEKRVFYEKLLALISFLILILFYITSYIYPLNGQQTTIRIADDYPNLFTPSAYTNIICIIIMLLLVGYSLYQLGVFLKDSGKLNNERNRQIRLCFILISFLSIIWLFAWNFDYIALSVVITIILVISLAVLNNVLSKEILSKSERIFIRLPFSIYYGYMLIMMVNNVITLLVSIMWNSIGIPTEIWLIGVLVLVLCIASYITQKNKDVVYCLTVVWEFIGILVKHFSKSELDGQYKRIIYVLIGCIIVLIGNVGYLLISVRKQSK